MLEQGGDPEGHRDLVRSVNFKPEGQPGKGVCKGMTCYVGKTKRMGVGRVATDKCAVFTYSSKGFQKALSIPSLSPSTPAGHPAIFFKSIRKGSKSRRRWQVPLKQLPMTAIINVCKSKQLCLPQCQNKQPATQTAPLKG